MAGSQPARVMKHITQSRTQKMWDADKEDKFTVEVRVGALFLFRVLVQLDGARWEHVIPAHWHPFSRAHIYQIHVMQCSLLWTYTVVKIVQCVAGLRCALCVQRRHPPWPCVKMFLGNPTNVFCSARVYLFSFYMTMLSRQHWSCWSSSGSSIYFGMISLRLNVLLPLSPFLCLCSQVQDLPRLHRDSGVIQGWAAFDRGSLASPVSGRSCQWAPGLIEVPFERGIIND